MSYKQSHILFIFTNNKFKEKVMDLKCKELCCTHNNNYACMAKRINVDYKANCKTYKIDPQKEIQDASKNMFEVAPDVHPYRHNKDVNIRCNCKCLFNDKGNCKANGITVSGKRNCACCLTVIER